MTFSHIVTFYFSRAIQVLTVGLYKHNTRAQCDTFKRIQRAPPWDYEKVVVSHVKPRMNGSLGWAVIGGLVSCIYRGAVTMYGCTMTGGFKVKNGHTYSI